MVACLKCQFAIDCHEFETHRSLLTERRGRVQIALGFAEIPLNDSKRGKDDLCPWGFVGCKTLVGQRYRALSIRTCLAQLAAG